MLNGKHIGTFAQEMKRLVTRPITSQVIQNKQDEILAKDAENGIEREHDDLVNTIATQLYNERSHNLSSLDKEINAINQESQRNQVRDAVFAKLKGMQGTAPADAKELTYDIFMKYEIDPLMKALDNKGVTASSIRFTEVAKAIASHYRVTPEALNAIEAKIEAEHKTAQKDIRLDVLNAIRTMELDRTAGGDNLEPQPAQ